MFACSPRRLSLTAFAPLFLASMALLSLSRIGLMIWQSDTLPDDSVLYILVQGLRYDLAAVAALFALPLLVIGIGSLFGLLPRRLLAAVKIWCAGSFAFLMLNEAATPGFILEYGVRPNHLYVQYLIYPQEVMATLWGGHKLELAASAALTALTFLWAYRHLSRRFARMLNQSPAAADCALPSRRRILVQLLLVMVLVPLGVRSTLGHRPLNPAMAAFCESPLINSLPVNSSYSAAYALAHLNDQKLTIDDIYALTAPQVTIAAGRRLSARTPAESGEACPLVQRIMPAAGLTAPRNVVIVLEESLGADFVQSLGGLPLTPNLERLKAQGWWFERMYAAGHRSIRGIEAVSAGFPPSPLDSVVKLPPKETPLSALPEIFNRLGYHTAFVYGGESHFDNMRSYFLNNGVQEVVEQKDYDHPEFVASWGVSDEDLFRKALSLMDQDYAAGRPFFSFIFTSSFHDPFEIPKGKVSLDFDGGDQTARFLAAKYADYALGKFMDAALKRDFAANTVFLIIADHESKVRGQNEFPLSKFRIPALIIAPGLTPHADPRIVSQIDMPPTLLALAGVDAAVPYVGQNLLRKDAKERALVEYNQIFGLLTPQGFTVLTPRKAPDQYRVSAADQLERTAEQPAVTAFAAAVENLGPLMYAKNYMSINCAQLPVPQS